MLINKRRVKEIEKKNSPKLNAALRLNLDRNDFAHVNFSVFFFIRSIPSELCENKRKVLKKNNCDRRNRFSILENQIGKLENNTQRRALATPTPVVTIQLSVCSENECDECAASSSEHKFRFRVDEIDN